MFVSLFRCSLSYLFIFVCLLFRPIYNMLMHNNTSSCAFWSAQWIEIYIIDFLALMQVRIDIMVSLERAQGCTRRRLPCSLGQSVPASWTGGLRISDLKSLGWALRMRWLWLQKTDPLRPWANLPIRVPDQVQVFFSVAITSEIGDGTRLHALCFGWIDGSMDKVLQALPLASAAIPKRRTKRHTVKEALTNWAWISDIEGALTVGVIVEYLLIWDLLLDIELHPEVEDSHIWKLSLSGQYSAESAYEGFFFGSTHFGPWERIWKTWAPAKWKIFLWLVAYDRCWTADRLACHELPHLARCALCDQESENVNNLLVSCVFTRQFWFSILRQVGLHSLSPQPTDNSFDEWWERASNAVSGMVKEGLNSLIILGAWTLWNHKKSLCLMEKLLALLQSWS